MFILAGSLHKLVRERNQHLIPSIPIHVYTTNLPNIAASIQSPRREQDQATIQSAFHDAEIIVVRG